MRVAFVINQFPPYITSGLGRYAEHIHAPLAELVDLEVFSLNDGGLPRHSSTPQGTPVHRPVGRIFRRLLDHDVNRTRRRDFVLLTAHVIVSNLRYVAQIAIRREARPDIVAVHDSTNFVCALLLRLAFRVPLVFHVHTTEYGVASRKTIRDPLGLFAAIERTIARLSESVIVATPEVRAQLEEAGWPKGRTEVVPLGGTFEREVPTMAGDLAAARRRAADLRLRLGISPATRMLLFVGRLEEQKGVIPLVRALPLVRTAIPDVIVVFLGQGDAAGVQKEARLLDVSDGIVHVGGFVEGEELMAYYQAADLCVFPSLFEPFGLVAAEAMSLGVPTILGDGFSRIFSGDPDASAVRRVESRSSRSIAAAIIALLLDDEERQRLGAAGASLAAAAFSWPRAAARTAEIYREAASSRRAWPRTRRGRSAHSSAP
ncbi:glycosyltransferase family 4 protein [Microbacterium sp. NPDC087665]|uniref:glycosyltransferase family 4 protein n=1 Tax=Microbacterium sp. NPDC087665 TaxID=3364194 RepID=UPI0038244CEA